MTEKKLVIDSIYIDGKKIKYSHPVFKDTVDYSLIRGGKGNANMSNSLWGRSMTGIIHEQKEEILKLEDVIKSMKSEIEYTLDSNKSEEVKRIYLKNAVRYANEVIYIK